MSTTFTVNQQRAVDTGAQYFELPHQQALEKRRFN